MKSKIMIVALALMMIMGVQSAKAWATWGHHIVAYIAEQHLTPETKSKCEDYLHHKVTHYSLWQDYWRNTFPFKASNDWHMNHVDENYNTIGIKRNINRDVVTQLNRIIGEMSKGQYHNMSDSLVNVNLKLLIHMMGDMHCPSHVGYHKNSGLKIPSIQIGKTKTHYHGFWDGAPQYMHPKWKADNFLKVCDTYSEKEIAKIQKGNPTKWAKENAEKMVKIFTYWDEDANIKTLSPEQRKMIDDTAFEQLAFAGYRLAAVLNAIFAK